MIIVIRKDKKLIFYYVEGKGLQMRCFLFLVIVKLGFKILRNYFGKYQVCKIV